MLHKTAILSLLISIVGCAPPSQTIKIGVSNPAIQYEGRIDFNQKDTADFYWSGTSVSLNFEGESISVELQDETGDNYYNVIVDQDSLFILRPDTSRSNYPLATGLSSGSHSLEIFKRTEWDRGKTSFFGFQLAAGGTVLPKNPEKERKIEFYGNSITAGYAVEDLTGADSPDSIYTNNYLSYARMTADHFNAEYQCICKSGIGITVSWFPLIMPEMFDRLIPEDPDSQWDFSQYTPDLVVINLFQNDSWIVEMPENDQFQNRFGNNTPSQAFIIEAYRNFVSSIRKVYPNAKIVCALGNMDATREGSPWPDYIQQAIDSLEDPNIYSHFMPYKNSPGHPTISEQRVMANSLIQFIDQNMEW